jgi:lipopolysaccharide export system protein LptA
MRTLVLGAGVLLLVCLGVFLAVGKWRNPFNRRDIPRRLGINIQQEANGVTYTQSHGGHTLFKIHASKVVQLKTNHALLDDVRIELYGADGSRVDRIAGDQFEYDQQSGTATAAGPVEITLMRPGVAPAIAPRATTETAAGQKPKASPLASAAQAAAAGQIHVKTSGLTFDQKTGVATTSRRVEFSMAQGSGSSMGATYDSEQGHLVLDRAVELTTLRGGQQVTIHAQHAEFEREGQVCRLQAATAENRGRQAAATEAKIFFREDGSAVRLDAAGGFTLTTATGAHLAAPTGRMDFDEHNQPRHGHLEGGVTMDSVNGELQVHGSSPTAELEFTSQGELRQAHLERGVEIHSEELSRLANSPAEPRRLTRSWRSPVAEIDFRNAGHGAVEPATMRGFDGVVISGESRRGNETPAPSRLSADEVIGVFGPGSELRTMTGVGHASIEETTAAGDRQFSSGDRLQAEFAAASATGAKGPSGRGAGSQPGSAQIQSAQLDGHVLLVQEPAANPRAPGAQAQPPLRATAGRAVYEGAGQWIHLTLSPRVEDGGLELTADKMDVSRESGDAFARGDVKATWADPGADRGGRPGSPANGAAGQGSVLLGGQGPAHAIAAEAELRQATGEATFRGHARLWQQTNSVAGPVVVLDRQKQSLVAQSADPAEPVRAVLVSAGSPAAGSEAAPQTARSSGRDGAGKPAEPSVIRVRGGGLWYSGAERKAVMKGGALGTVVAETGTAESVSDEVDLTLLPAGDRAPGNAGQSQVDRMTARGHVTVSSQGRRGAGEQLVYTGASGEYVLTGSASAPPRLTDPQRGTVTGEALIFHSRDDSVSIEGGQQRTTTQTTAPR